MIILTTQQSASSMKNLAIKFTGLFPWDLVLGCKIVVVKMSLSFNGGMNKSTLNLQKKAKLSSLLSLQRSTGADGELMIITKFYGGAGQLLAHDTGFSLPEILVSAACSRRLVQDMDHLIWQQFPSVHIHQG